MSLKIDSVESEFGSICLIQNYDRLFNDTTRIFIVFIIIIG